MWHKMIASVLWSHCTPFRFMALNLCIILKCVTGTRVSVEYNCVTEYNL